MRRVIVFGSVDITPGLVESEEGRRGRKHRENYEEYPIVLSSDLRREGM